ncbi:Gfo/Idh/MocA family oxidoreductase [Streptomyces sp. MS2A]|nr:Gfo/Idh/MocA family oxidoreductase [Streptomyces sp. MS2A]
MTAPQRIAVLGAGAIGAVHARLVSALAETEGVLAAIVDVDPARARALAEPYRVPAFTTLAQARAEAGVDVVAICLPSAYHADAAVEALESGLDVIVEKPIDIALDAADRVIAAERASGRTVSVISQRRFQPAAAFLHRAIEDGELGRITSGIAESAFFRPQAYYDSGDWRGTAAIDGGGALMNQGIHALDLLLWMLGTPVSVQAATGRVAHEGIEVEDVAGATITFANGAIGVLLASTAAYPGLPVRLAVHGDRGTGVMEDDRLSVFTAASGLAPGPDDVEERSVPEGWSAVDVAHLRQYRDVLDAIAQGRAPAITTRDGRRALQVVLAVYESARTGRPVTLEHDAAGDAPAARRAATPEPLKENA